MFQLILPFQLELPFEAGGAPSPRSGALGGPARASRAKRPRREPARSLSLELPLLGLGAAPGASRQRVERDV